MRRLILVIAATVLTTSQAAYGDVGDLTRVKRLLQMCNQPAGPKTAIQGIDGAICLGYISGIMEAFDMLQRICVPKLVPGVDPTLPIIRYLNAHSEMQEWLAPIAILTAAERAYPCAKL